MDIHISPLIFSETFLRPDINSNLRSNLKSVVPNVRFDFCGIESVSYLGPKIWNIVLLKLKELTTVDAFKKGIHQWKSKFFHMDNYVMNFLNICSSDLLYSKFQLINLQRYFLNRTVDITLHALLFCSYCILTWIFSKFVHIK